jgi:hypothetical protein
MSDKGFSVFVGGGEVNDDLYATLGEARAEAAKWTADGYDDVGIVAIGGVSVWDFLELPNPRASHAQALYSWGLNCDRTGNPFLLFLDLIGWTDDNYGEETRLMERGSHYGYTELGYLADALTEYADRPHDVRAWVDDLMECEGV